MIKKEWKDYTTAEKVEIGASTIIFVGAILFLSLIVFTILLGEDEIPHKIHFDNGFDNNLNIFVDNKSAGSINPKSFGIVNITSGVHKIDIIKDNGELFESNNITLGIWQPNSPRYIYNIGRKYSYYTEICKYGDEREKRTDAPEEYLGNNTLIEYTSYELECPDKIYVPKGTKYAIKKKISKRIDKPE